MLKRNQVRLDRMRRHRTKHLPHFKVEYIDRDVVVDAGFELIPLVQRELFEAFILEMRARRYWNPKPVEYDIFQDYDISFNRYRVGIQERFLHVPKG